MYTGSHLKLILAILLVPSIFIFLIAADSENRNFITDPELTVEKISLDPVTDDLNLSLIHISEPTRPERIGEWRVCV